jgi:TrmH family RNA methyltransferase
MKRITSRENPQWKALRALATETRQTRRQGRALLDGPHLVATYRERVGLPELLVVGDSASGNAEIGALLAAMPTVDTLQVTDALFRELSPSATPVGLLAAIAIPEPTTAPIAGSCVVLDAVQDAGNVGAILRTAAAAGIAEVLLGPGCAGVWTPRVLRAAQGAHFALRLREVGELSAALRDFPGRRLATVARDGQSLYEADLSGPLAWLFGNEGSGLSAPVAALADLRVCIPLASTTESLNVAAAAAVCLFESLRRRRGSA